VKPLINNPPPAISSKRWLSTEIPSEVYDQEREIESMIRTLSRFDEKGSHNSKYQSHAVRRQESAALIFIAFIGS